jgi:SAM-dependent methyltransferase
MNSAKRLIGNAVLGTQRAMTAVGERTGLEWLIYNPLARYGFERAARRNAPITIEAIARLFPTVRTAVDVGCGTGRYVMEMRARGIDAIGLEYAPTLRRKCARRGITVLPFDVSVPTPQPEGRPFDLAISFEVAEHVPATLADDFARFFAGLARRVVFTAAHPGQGGTSHINEQPREYWIDKFDANGFALDESLTRELASQWERASAHWYLPRNLSVFSERH